MILESNELIVRSFERWRNDPVAFAKDFFGVELDPWQADVMRAFPTNNRIAMRAAKGCGKSTLLALLAWNFLITRPEVKIVATSITGENLADGLWSEMAKWQNKNKWLKEAFTWTKTRIFLTEAPETHFMSARSWPKSGDPGQQADTLAGLHADYMLFILDEVGGIPDAVIVAAEAGLSSGIETKIVMAGNPTHLEGPLYRACTTQRSLWWLSEVTGDPDDPKRAPRISVQWAREQIEQFGRDNPWVLVNVFGRFPPSSINSLLGPDDVTVAMHRGIRLEQYDFAQKRIGVDVARFGSDATVLFPRQGLRAFKPVIMRNARTNEIAARIMAGKAKFNSEVELIDDTGGYGGGVVDALIQAGQNPLGVNFSGKATDSRYFNKRSEMWFEMAEWVKRGGCLPYDTELVRELTSPTYTFHNGKLRVEEKEQIKKRIGHSTDMSDALCLTFALPEMPAAMSILRQMENDMAVMDYDPLAENTR
jgi:hypothetical protein